MRPGACFLAVAFSSTALAEPISTSSVEVVAGGVDVLRKETKSVTPGLVELSDSAVLPADDVVPLGTSQAEQDALEAALPAPDSDQETNSDVVKVGLVGGARRMPAAPRADPEDIVGALPVRQPHHAATEARSVPVRPRAGRRPHHAAATPPPRRFPAAASTSDGSAVDVRVPPLPTIGRARAAAEELGRDTPSKTLFGTDDFDVNAIATIDARPPAPPRGRSVDAYINTDDEVAVSAGEVADSAGDPDGDRIGFHDSLRVADGNVAGTFGIQGSVGASASLRNGGAEERRAEDDGDELDTDRSPSDGGGFSASSFFGYLYDRARFLCGSCFFLLGSVLNTLSEGTGVEHGDDEERDIQIASDPVLQSAISSRLQIQDFVVFVLLLGVYVSVVAMGLRIMYRVGGLNKSSVRYYADPTRGHRRLRTLGGSGVGTGVGSKGVCLGAMRHPALACGLGGAVGDEKTVQGAGNSGGTPADSNRAEDGPSAGQASGSVADVACAAATRIFEDLSATVADASAAAVAVPQTSSDPSSVPLGHPILGALFENEEDHFQMDVDEDGFASMGNGFNAWALQNPNTSQMVLCDAGSAAAQRDPAHISEKTRRKDQGQFLEAFNGLGLMGCKLRVRAFELDERKGDLRSFEEMWRRENGVHVNVTSKSDSAPPVHAPVNLALPLPGREPWYRRAAAYELSLDLKDVVRRRETSDVVDVDERRTKFAVGVDHRTGMGIEGGAVGGGDDEVAVNDGGPESGSGGQKHIVGALTPLGAAHVRRFLTGTPLPTALAEVDATDLGARATPASFGSKKSALSSLHLPRAWTGTLRAVWAFISAAAGIALLLLQAVILWFELLCMRAVGSALNIGPDDHRAFRAANQRRSPSNYNFHPFFCDAGAAAKGPHAAANAKGFATDSGGSSTAGGDFSDSPFFTPEKPVPASAVAKAPSSSKHDSASAEATTETDGDGAEDAETETDQDAGLTDGEEGEPRAAGARSRRPLLDGQHSAAASAHRSNVIDLNELHSSSGASDTDSGSEGAGFDDEDEDGKSGGAGGLFGFFQGLLRPNSSPGGGQSSPGSTQSPSAYLQYYREQSRMLEILLLRKRLHWANFESELAPKIRERMASQMGALGLQTVSVVPKKKDDENDGNAKGKLSRDWEDWELVLNKSSSGDPHIFHYLEIALEGEQHISVFRNEPWANFVLNKTTAGLFLCALGPVGFLWYIPYLLRYRRYQVVESGFEVGVTPAQYWAAISPSLGFDAQRGMHV